MHAEWLAQLLGWPQLRSYLTRSCHTSMDVGRDGRIMPKNLLILIMLFGIAMIFAQILCQNMPTQIHN